MAGCSGGGSTTAAGASKLVGRDDHPTPSTTAAAPPMTEDPKAAVEAAYLAYWALFDRLSGCRTQIVPTTRD